MHLREKFLGWKGAESSGEEKRIPVKFPCEAYLRGSRPFFGKKPIFWPILFGDLNFHPIWMKLGG